MTNTLTLSVDVGTEMKLSVGSKLSGKYMGFDFAGTVDVICANNPVYHQGQETISVWIKLGAPLFGEYGLMKHDIGDCIGMICRPAPGGIKRTDKRYTEIKKHFTR